MAPPRVLHAQDYVKVVFYILGHFLNKFGIICIVRPIKKNETCIGTCGGCVGYKLAMLLFTFTELTKT